MADGLQPQQMQSAETKEESPPPSPFDYKLPGASNTQTVLEISNAEKDLGVMIDN